MPSNLSSRIARSVLCFTPPSVCLVGLSGSAGHSLAPAPPPVSRSSSSVPLSGWNRRQHPPPSQSLHKLGTSAPSLRPPSLFHSESLSKYLSSPVISPIAPPPPSRVIFPSLEVLKQGSPDSGPQTGTSCLVTGSISLGIECVVNGTHLNHPQTTLPTLAQGKTVFCETGPKRLETAVLMDPSLIIPDSL